MNEQRELQPGPRHLTLCGAILLLAVSAALPGCGNSQAQSQMPPTMAADVEVALPITREITDFEEFTGRTESVQPVNVVARATGYLKEVRFKEGALVKKGDLLFEIDPRPYQALYDQAMAQVKLTDAQVNQAVSDNARSAELSKTEGAISRQDIDRYQHTMEQMQATHSAAVAALETARINLDFCRVTSPIDGRISRYYITPGNMVTADQTLLTNVVSVNPIYAYFDIDERTFPRAKKIIEAAKRADAKPAVAIGLADETGFPHRGYIDFIDNHLDPNTGTIRARGVFANPDYTLTPGLFARVQLPVSKPYQGILVPEKALQTDQGRRFVYVIRNQPVLDKNKKPEVGPDGKAKTEVVASYQRVKEGPLEGELRVIESGLKANEQIVVNGLQRIVKDGTPVNPKVVSLAKEMAATVSPDDPTQAPIAK